MAFSRKMLYEMLNRAKTEIEEQQPSTSSDSGSNVSMSTGESSNSVNVNTELPGGAGRAKIFNKLKLNSSQSSPSRESTSISAASESPSGRASTTSQEIISQVDKIGTKGEPIPLVVNYIPIKCEPNTSIFEYEVRYEPNIHSNMIRRGLLASAIRPHMPVFTFDGTCLYLPRRFPEDTTILRAVSRDSGQPIEMSVIFKHQKTMKESIHFYNVLFKQVMLKLEYVQFGQKMFDPTEPKTIPHRQLTIWPGYVMACDEFDGGLMLTLDTSHRVLFNSKVSDLLRKIAMSCKQHPSQNFKDMVEKSLLGSVILTPYNNKTYTIQDIDFDQTPLNKFKTRDGETTYVDYYKNNYGIEIHDLGQPMLLSYKDRKMATQNGRCQQDRLTIALIPELSQLTGLTDEMRSDKMVMRDIASYTRVTPNQRIEAAKKFIAKVNEMPSAREILDNWGLRLCDDLLRLEGRQLPFEKIKFGDRVIINDVSGDFAHQIGGNTLFDVVDLTNWILMFTKQDTRTKDEFLTQMTRCASGMGLTWNRPVEYLLPDDRTDTYAIALRKCLQPNTQMAVFICPTSRVDRYAVIKKICCSEKPIASQVINARTLIGWVSVDHSHSIRIPFENVMICGSDTYHGTNKTTNSVAAFVASLNDTYTKWYSKAIIQSNREELMHGLTASLEGALQAYKKYNNVYPDRIIFYRDGVGNGQFNVCREFEFPQLKKACRLLDANYNPNITFIIVQKRINTRIYVADRGSDYFDNPPPGTVVDHSITRHRQYFH